MDALALLGSAIKSFIKLQKPVIRLPDPVSVSQAPYLEARTKLFMRRIFLLLFVAVAVTMSSCAVHIHESKVPPGQAKKTSAPPGQVKKQTGSQSAKPYAPGQKKKS